MSLTILSNRLFLLNCLNQPFTDMKTLIPISLKRIALKNMQAVQDGLLDYERASETIRELMTDRSGVIEQLTRSYDEEYLRALKFFRLL